MQNFDIAIIGGGPAGASAAITLARSGYQVLLMDRAIFPREKLCGDFINPINWPVFRELKVDGAISNLEHAEVRRFRLTLANGAEAAALLPASGRHGYGLGLRRYYLDNVLIERAKSEGATILEGAKAKQLHRTTAGWVVEFEQHGDLKSCRSKILIGADGRNSWVARLLGVTAGGGIQPGAVGFAIQLKSVGGLKDSVEIHQFPGGYAGLVRVDSDTVNLAFAIERSVLPRPASFDTLRTRRLNQNRFLRDQLRDTNPSTELRSVVPVFSRRRGCYGDGFLLIGDAARATEPVTGEGIYFALRSGQLAAETIDGALRRGDIGAHGLRQFQSACREQFRQRFRLNLLASVLAHHPLLLTALVHFSPKRPHLLNSLVQSVCGSRA